VPSRAEPKAPAVGGASAEPVVLSGCCASPPPSAGSRASGEAGTPLVAGGRSAECVGCRPCGECVSERSRTCKMRGDTCGEVRGERVAGWGGSSDAEPAATTPEAAAGGVRAGRGRGLLLLPAATAAVAPLSGVSYAGVVRRVPLSAAARLSGGMAGCGEVRGRTGDAGTRTPGVALGLSRGESRGESRGDTAPPPPVAVEVGGAGVGGMSTGVVGRGGVGADGGAKAACSLACGVVLLPAAAAAAVATATAAPASGTTASRGTEASASSGIAAAEEVGAADAASCWV
jgi:hypothetical protein